MFNKNSTNDYLERILIIHKRKGFVRSVDLARELGVTKPTVCDAVKRLRDRWLIDVADKGHIILTEDGRAIAEKVYNKHQFLKKSLTRIGVNEITADKDASMIEHVISEETYKCLVTHFKHVIRRADNVKRSIEFSEEGHVVGISRQGDL